MTDIIFMERALQLAQMGQYSVAPNPMVGCVIVYNHKIIGEGYHQQYGQNHAEVNAINSVTDKSLLLHSTLYVTLEPCAHFGKTPPCANLIVQYNFKKVIVCNLDPNPLVAGKGIAIIQNAGIEVETGLLEKKGLLLNQKFFTFQNKKRPFVTLKWAQTSNGYIDDLETKPLKISNEISTKWVHSLRASHMGIMVGTNTIIKDDPLLSTRHWQGKNPVKVIIDKQLRIKAQAQILNNEAPCLIYNWHGSNAYKNAQYIQLPENDNMIPDILQDLFNQNIQSVLVEGGTKLLQSFINQNLWDQAFVIKSLLPITGGILGPILNNIPNTSIYLGSDSISHFLNNQ